MNIRKLYVTLLLVIGASLSAFSQKDTIGLNTMMLRTAKLGSTHPIEKVYLHFDKPYYAIGDTVWFKAYVTADTHLPSQISKIVYVDVINAKDSIAQTLKLQVLGSVAFGNVLLNAPLYKQGNYHFRAYTNWMRNDDPAYFFNKTIPVAAVEKQIITNISVSGSTKANTSKVTAKVIFKDPTGKPYANKRVNWKVVNDEETLAKGKGNTAVNGVLDVTFTTNKTTEVPTAELQTELSVTDEKTVNNTFSLTHALDQPDVQLFPEGGDLISGLRCKVAVKAIAPNGLGIDFKGTVTDNNGTNVAEFTSQHLGMGVFTLQPEAGKTYKANVTFADGSQSSYPLPAVRAEGITLSVVNTDPVNLEVKLTANPSFLQKNQDKVFYMMGTVGENVFYAGQTRLQRDSYLNTIPKTRFPAGIVKFTLFNERGEAQAERIVFVMNNGGLMNLSVKSPQVNFATRQKVTLNIAATAAAKPSEAANLSLTVLDENKVPYDDRSEITILTNLLLTSELKGYVEKPNYYFDQPNQKTADDLDALMLTQGYRRFSFKDLVDGRYPPAKYDPEQGIDIKGTLRNATGLPISRGNLTMIIGDRKSAVPVVTNAVGEFRFANLMYPDSTKITINAPSSNFMIMLENNPLAPPTPNVNAADGVSNIDSSMTAYIDYQKQKAARSHLLSEVTIRSSNRAIEKKPSHEDYPGLMGLNPFPDAEVTGERLNISPLMSDALKGGGFGLTYNENKLYITRNYDSGNKKEVALYYNGMPVDLTFLQGISTSDVASVEVFRDDGVSGVNRMDGTAGVVVINPKPAAKQPHMSRAEVNAFLSSLQHSAQSLLFKGYTSSRMFYSPKYDPAKTYPLGGDMRSTIYWNPKVMTDKNGNATVEFYNADGKGSYRAILEGIDANGNIGRYVYHYTVQ